MIQTRPFTVVLSACLILIGTGCSFSKKASRSDARKALENADLAPEIVQAVLTRQILEPELTDQLLALESHHVDYILASNAHLDGSKLSSLVAHANTEVRAEVAQHPNLTDAQIDQLAQDPARVVYGNLARNPDVSKPVLKKLYEERQPDLIHFAYNPNCPADIREEILQSGDAKAIQWVKTNDEAREIIQAKTERLDRIAKARNNR